MTVSGSEAFYDDLSSDYDRFVNWPGRLGVEMPFLVRQLQEAGSVTVLDAACGTGRHAIALAQAGFGAAGADLSSGMVAAARANAAQAGQEVRFEQAGFGELTAGFGRGSFQALICLGNSLPHLLSEAALAAALADFAECLAPGGVLVLQNRNFDAILASRQRWMEPQAASSNGKEWLFVRFYDFEPDGLLTFQMLTLKREQPGAGWRQAIHSTPLRPLPAGDLLAQLEKAGFRQVCCYGDLGGAPFEPETSPNLVVTAFRS